MTTPAALCVLCSRREAKVGRLCTSDADRLSRHLDPANAGVPFNPDKPDDPVRPASIPRLYAELVELRIAAGESAHEHADAAEINEHRASLSDVRSKATGPGLDDDGPGGPPSVISTLGGWARIVHEEHLDFEGRPDPLPALARPAWVEVTGPTTRTVEVTVTGRVAPASVPGLVGDDLGQAPEGAALPDRVVQVRAPGPAAVRRQRVAAERPDVQAVTTLCRWLHARRDWIAEQAWVDEFVGDLRRLTSVLNAGRGDPGSRPLGPCPALVDDLGHPWSDEVGHCTVACPDELHTHGPYTCHEPLYLPSLPPRGPGEALAVPSVRCDSCGARYSGLDLLAFAAEQGIPIP